MKAKAASKQRRGFASMDPKTKLRIARAGGRAVSKNRRHMAEIGRIGGANSNVNRRRTATRPRPALAAA